MISRVAVNPRYTGPRYMKQTVVLSVLFTLSLMAADPADAVREAAEAWTTAVVKQDGAALQRLLADDLIFVHSGGGTPQNKAQYIASPENSDYDALPLRDISIRIYGDTAVLSAFLDTKHKGREPSPVKTLQIFKRNNGQWQLAAFQATRISPPPPR